MLNTLKIKALVEKPSYIVKPIGSKVLVVAPHPDDEVIGCGGVLLKHVCCGDQIRICYVTATVKSTYNRKEEAFKVNEVLGIKKPVFLDVDEKVETVSDEAIEKLTNLINELSPDVIYIPNILERHIDHLNSNIILYYALLKCNNLNRNIHIYCYEVWTSLVPNYLVNITDFISKKIDVLKMYESQLIQYDYINLVDSMGKLRCYMYYPDAKNYKVVVNDYKFGQKYCKKSSMPWTHVEAFKMYEMIEYMQLIEELMIVLNDL